jgi:flagellar hook-associated protein 1 FlgK
MLSSINTALTALRYNQVSLDNAAQNIANVGTDGYTRRRVDSVTAGTASAPAMWSRGGDYGSGVRVTGVNRMTDAFLDARVRSESGKQSYLDTRQAVLSRLETGIGEPGPNGVAAVVNEFRTAWADLSNNPGNDAARSQVLARGAALADAIALQTRNFTVEAADQRVRVTTMVDEVNTLSADLAATNTAIQVAGVDGTQNPGLLDQRDQIALRLSELTGGTAEVNAANGLDFAVGGTALVTGSYGGRLEIASGVTADGAADGAGITFRVTHPSTSPFAGSTAVASTLSGEIGAVATLLDATIPSYLSELDGFAAGLADAVNALHQQGYDATGAPGGTFFDYDPADPAATLKLAVSAESGVAASGLPGGVVDGAVADKLADLAGPGAAYQRIVNGFGTSVASAARLTASQQMLTDQVNGSRDQLAGVSLDEEMLSMVEYQRGYEAAARVLTTVDSMLDTLINRTGLTR